MDDHEPGYRIACICPNGHSVSSNIEEEAAAKFCPKCGEATRISGEGCNSPYRGYYVNNWSGHDTAPEGYCFSCGIASPWTKRRLDAIMELAEAIESLTDNEREQLHELMPHLVTEGPPTPAAGSKIAAILGKVTGPAKKLLQDAVVSLAVDAGKKALGL